MDEFDLDFDVSDLREPPPADTAAAAADDHPRVPRPVISAARGRSRLAPRTRAILTIAAALLVALALLLSVPQAPATLVALLRLPTPTAPPPLPVGADTLVLQHTVPWGVLRVDGAPVRHLGTALVPPNTKGAQLPALTLARGQHTLSYDAAPFPTLRCTVSVPAAASDSCPLGPRDVTGPLETFGLVRIVDLGAMPARLPQAQRDALVSAVAAAVAAQSPSTTLPPGEPYLAADGTPAIAREPLVATLRSTLDSGAYAPGPDGEGACPTVCTNAHDQVSFSAWLLTGQVDLSWLYTPLSGPSYGGDIAPGSPHMADMTDVLVTWDGSWQVTLAPLSSVPICDIAQAAVVAELERHGLTVNLACTAAEHPADGCLMTAQPLDAARQPAGQELALYYRFGMLFAADALTRQWLPDLPPARPAALALLPPLHV